MLIGSYFKTAVRAIARDRFHAAINVIGLSVALAAALLIGVYVRHELSYENFITEPDRVYRVEADYTLPGQTMDRWAVSPYPVPELLEADYGEQVTATRLSQRNLVLTADGERFRRAVHIADENFFAVIDLPVVAGDAAAAMREPGSLILSRQTAVQLFGTEDAIGRTLQINGTTDLAVAAILEDAPSNTQFEIEILGSIASMAFAYPPQMSTNWGNVVQETFVRLHDGAQGDAIAADMPAFVARHKPGNFNFTVDLNLRPLRQLHLAASPDGKVSSRNSVALGALAATGAFLIFIACFSYMNLATARSLLRIKEVGLRKILGGRSHHLAFQFLAEAAVITALAFLIGAVFAAILMRPFARLVDRELRILDMADPVFIAAALGLIVIVSIGAGAYPALVLASRKPIALFQGKRGAGGAGGLLRTGIVSIQFGMTAALMIAAVVVFAQINYLRNIDLGFEERGLLMIPIFPDLGQEGRGDLFREQLAQSPYIESVAGGGTTPTPAYELYMPLSKPGDAPGTEQSVLNVTVGDQFFDVYSVAPVAGRVFSDDPTQDVFRQPTPDQPEGQGPMVLSASAVPFLGLGQLEEAVGKELIFSNAQGTRILFSVIGVVPDLHFRLGRQEMMPMVFLPRPPGTGGIGEITARVRAGAFQAGIEDAQRIWAEIFPEEAMTYQFLEDRIAAANADDERQSGLFAFFAVLALFVACVGLFALSSFVVARRTYEVAVRKTIGASTASVTRLLMWDFAKPVLLANLIAWPIAWLIARAWLERFPERIALSPVFFLGVSAAALIVAMLTILARTLRSARVHPAIVLRSE
jgi:putative ABC transport system permease protein